MKSLKRIQRALSASALTFALLSCATAGSVGYVDAYTSASEQSSKATVSGAAFEAVGQALEAGSSDLADAAAAKTAGYAAPKSFIVNVLTANPDGSIGISTISQWAYKAVPGGTHKATAQLTFGQNALNIAAVGKGWSLFIPGVTVNGKAGRYLLHLRVSKVDIMEYSDEAFKAGKFNAHYSGAEAKKKQYTIVSDVLSIEEVSGSVKLGMQMP